MATENFNRNKNEQINQNTTETCNVGLEKYFTFFEHTPISLWIEDFSEAKNYLDSKLKNTNMDLRTYISQNPDVISKVASMVSIKDVNSTSLKMYKAKSKEELFENLNKVFTPKSNEGFAKLIVNVLLGEKETEIETVNKTLEGEEFDVLIKFKVVEGSEKSLDNIIVSVENISDRIKVLKALAESKRRYKESQEIAKIGSWFYDYNTDKVSWSDETYKMIGMEPQSVEPNYDFYMSLIHEEDKDLVNDFDSLLKTPNQILKYRILTKTGKLKYIYEKRSVLIKDNKITKIIGICQDITERVEAELKLNTTKNLLSDTLSSINDGFVILDNNSHYLFVNEKAAELLGKKVDELIGKHIWTEFPEQEGDLFYDEYQNAVKTKKPSSFENYFAAWERWFENRMIPSKDGMLIFFQEITEKKISEFKIREAYDIINKSSSVAVLCKNEKDFPVIFASENTKTLFGYNQSEMLTGKIKVHQLVHPDDLPKLRTKVFEISKNLKVEGFKSKPFRIITKDGEIKWVETKFDVNTNNSARVTHIQGIVEDVTERKKAQDAFIESSQRLRDQFSNTPLASIIWDTKMNVLEWNNSAQRIFGYSEEEIIGKNGFELIVPKELRPNIKESAKILMTQKGGYRNTNQNITKNGEIITCDWYNVVLKDADGNSIGMASLAEDITEKLNSKKLLEKSEKKYRDIFEKSIDAVMILKDGLFEDCNESTLRIFGFEDKESLINLHPSEISPKYQQDGSDSFTRAEEVIRVAIKKGGNRFRWLHKRKNGQIFPAEVSLTKIEENDDKTKIHAVVRDITDRVKKEELEGVLYNISEAALRIDDFNEFGIFIKNEIHKIIDTSNFCIALFDKKKGDISYPINIAANHELKQFSGNKILTQYVIESKKPLLATKESLKNLESKGVDISNIESKIWVGVPLKIQNDVVGAIAVHSFSNENIYVKDDLQLLEFVANQISFTVQRKNADNELKKALVKAQESDKLKSAFLANMSHEIRTPMNGIIGFSELFLDSELSANERKEYAKIVINSSKQLLSIVNDILDISKIEAGVVKLNYGNVNLNELLGELFLFYNSIAKEKKLKLNYNTVLEDADSNILIDKTKLNQVLTNLLSNAFKFTESGEISFGYKVDNDQLKFYVKDTGIGIDKELQSKIFERFIQANVELNKRNKGTGLGLAISKKFIELFKGEMWIESSKKGTTVFFTIPFNKVDSVIIKKESKKLKSEMNTKNDIITILVAEDEEYNMIYINELFSNTNFKIIEADNGVKAVDLAINNDDIDLIFMDIKMPLMNGNEAMEQIKKVKPNLPIIALSAFAMESDKENALNKGFDSYLTKPINKNELFNIIDEYLN